MHWHPSATSPLGIFDSGVGGLTVLKKMHEVLPQEDVVYLGDTARLPYGNKGAETIVRLSLENAGFLQSKQIKLLVIACNTAAAHASLILREKLPVPVLDVIEPAVDCAVAMTVNGKIAVLGTRATISSGVYERKIKERLLAADVLSLSCPLLVPFVEEGSSGHPACRLILKEYLEPVKVHGCDTVILGCTHYPLLSTQIQDILGEEVAIVDAALLSARKVLEILERDQMKNPLSHPGHTKYFVSDDAASFSRSAQALLGLEIEEISLYSACAPEIVSV